MSRIPKPVVLVILDGFGESRVERGNPVFSANMPTINKLSDFYPKMLLQASGMSVGLPWKEMGNSEVGHQALGSGQIIFQYRPRIDASISDNSFFKNESFLMETDKVKKQGSKLHLFGLVSDGGVHSHIDHLMALINLASEQGVRDVCVHVIADGRDTKPKSAEKYIKYLQNGIREAGVGRIASISGRYYAMDRNNNWDRIELAFRAMLGESDIKATDPIEAIYDQYGKIDIDEYIKPITIVDEGGDPVGPIEDNDAVICFNYREDRARQMAKVFCDDDLGEFKDTKMPSGLSFTGFVKYADDIDMRAAYLPQKITSRIGKILSRNNKKQLRIAETEKYAHVTYFFNGGLEEPFSGEDRKVIPSKNTPSYAEVPEMSARGITDYLLSVIGENKYDFILVNYANPDMVGHTGDFKAAVKALEAVDANLGELVEGVLSQKGLLLITADHGNVEEMIDLQTGQIDTEHSSNPVPCWIVSEDYHCRNGCTNNDIKYADGMLVDVAPTLLDIMGMPRGKGMIGRSLLDVFNKKRDKS